MSRCLALVVVALAAGASAFRPLAPPSSAAPSPTRRAAAPVQVAGWGLASAVGAAYVAYDRRPRGWTVDGAVVPGESTVPGAGRGLFAARALVEGEELGAYPGLVFNAESWAASKGGDTTACAYVWDIGNGLCCDPSDASGSLPDVVRAPWWPFEVKTTLALVNELVNARWDVRPASAEVMLLVLMDVPAGAELFCDYGPNYDRSGYGG